MTYEITKTFIGGLLKGLTITEHTTARFTAGQVVAKPVAGSPYRVDRVAIVEAR